MLSAESIYYSLYFNKHYTAKPLYKLFSNKQYAKIATINLLEQDRIEYEIEIKDYKDDRMRSEETLEENKALINMTFEEYKSYCIDNYEDEPTYEQYEKQIIKSKSVIKLEEKAIAAYDEAIAEKEQTLINLKECLNRYDKSLFSSEQAQEVLKLQARIDYVADKITGILKEMKINNESMEEREKLKLAKTLALLDQKLAYTYDGIKEEIAAL